MKHIEIRWTGPFGFPKYEDSLPEVPSHPGVYLYTVEYQDGFLVCSPGITQRSIRQRMLEHRRKFLTGDYNVLDADALKRAVRTEVWHGWSWTEQKRADFENRRDTILPAIERQLRAYCMFVTEAGDDKRFLQRIEASIMQSLYNQPSPHRDILDEDMHFARRRHDEEPITVTHVCASTLYGIPKQLVM